MTRNDPSRRRTDQYYLFTYFQLRYVFHLRCQKWFLRFHSFTLRRKETFSSCDLEIWPMTLTHKIDLYVIEKNHLAKYPGQRSLSSTVIVRKHRHARTQQTDCTTRTTKWHKYPFNGLFSRTTWVSRHQKGYTNLDYNEATDDWVPVASAGPYANHLKLTPDR